MDDVIKMRVCNRCRENKPQSDYAPSAWDRSGGFHGCRDCRVEVNRSQRLKSRYGITTEEWQALFIKQKGKCAICKRLPRKVREDRRFPLVVDHCHDTGRVRGLLCDSCNVSLGRLGDNEDALTLVLEYVRNGWR